MNKSSASSEDFATRLRMDQKISSIEIDIETLKLPYGARTHVIMERPVSIRGVVFPIRTQERKITPDPVAFESLTHYIQSVTKRRKFRLLSPDSDRGHIFALELGGPNCKYNIIPQWSGFQEHGDWRRLEKNIRHNAVMLMNHQNSVFLECHIEYINLNMKDLQERLNPIFSLRDDSEDKIKKCLQIFGIPIGYSFNSFPCNLNIKKPRLHGLSLPYIQHLYKITQKIWSDERNVNFETKVKTAQMSFDHGWGIKKLKATDLLNLDPRLRDDINKFCISGSFALSTVTEEDL